MRVPCAPCRRVMLRAAFGRERQHGDARLLAEQRLRAARRGDGDVGEFARIWIGIDRAIGKDEGLRPAPEEIRNDDQEIARRQRYALASPTVIRPASITRRVGLATPGDHGVGVALTHHHAAEIEGLRQQARRHRRRHGFPRGRAGGAVSSVAAHRCADRPSSIPSSESPIIAAVRGDGAGFAEQDRPRDLLGSQPDRGGDDARIVAFRQNDFAIASACDIKQSIKQFHASHRVRKLRSRRGHQWTKPLKRSRFNAASRASISIVRRARSSMARPANCAIAATRSTTLPSIRASRKPLGCCCTANCRAGRNSPRSMRSSNRRASLPEPSSRHHSLDQVGASDGRAPHGGIGARRHAIRTRRTIRATRRCAKACGSPRRCR